MSAIPKGVALFLYGEPLLKSLIGKAATGAIAADAPYRELPGNTQGLIVNPQGNPLCDVWMRLGLPRSCIPFAFGFIFLMLADKQPNLNRAFNEPAKVKEDRPENRATFAKDSAVIE